MVVLCCVCAAMAQEKIQMLVGTYTDDGSKGIYSCCYDLRNGEMTILDVMPVKNPSYLTISDNGHFIYAVRETNDEKAALITLGFDKNTGKMTRLDSVPTGGGDPCYVSTNGKYVLTANYSGGSMTAFQLQRKGAVAKHYQKFMGTTGGPDLTRQDTPHVHCACFTPDGKYILATDFSADRILSFSIEGKDIYENGVAAKVSADSGPRHLVFSGDGRYAYLMSELSGNVTAFSYQDGKLKSLQEIVSDTVGARGGADIHLSPDGKFLYTSNRLKSEGIAIFAVDSETGLLTRIGDVPTGAHPRQFNITPDGRYLFCCCRDSNKIQVFRRNLQTGALTDTHKDIKLSWPVCVQFY